MIAHVPVGDLQSEFRVLLCFPGLWPLRVANDMCMLFDCICVILLGTVLLTASLTQFNHSFPTTVYSEHIALFYLRSCPKVFHKFLTQRSLRYRQAYVGDTGM
jgi:hypothetical protein